MFIAGSIAVSTAGSIAVSIAGSIAVSTAGPIAVSTSGFIAGSIAVSTAGFIAGSIALVFRFHLLKQIIVASPSGSVGFQIHAIEDPNRFDRGIFS
ncbi:hypothetical protein RRG08_032142 [Elysia crispata]|uniref:Uncharacterized protein n=1 Tax=Elysia crispata TaxID=231223 RepID=A0AAE1DC56_9GAST|nr:hypothetical protein RRG08_032142 [Elysia crispata]